MPNIIKITEKMKKVRAFGVQTPVLQKAEGFILNRLKD